MRSELQTILPSIITLRRQITPYQKDILGGGAFSQEAFGLFANFPRLHEAIKSLHPPPVWLLFGIAYCLLQDFIKKGRGIRRLE